MRKIEKIELFPVAIPLNHPYKSATRMATHSEDIIVKITCATAFPAGEERRSARFQPGRP